MLENQMLNKQNSTSIYVFLNLESFWTKDTIISKDIRSYEGKNKRYGKKITSK